MLSCFGSRGWISTKAMPQFAGKPVNNFLNVSRPPAVAPRATTGKSILVCLENACSFGCGRVRPACRGLRAVIVVAFVSPASMRETRATQSHLTTSVVRARLKQDLRCCPSFRHASTKVGTLRTLATTCPLVCSYKLVDRHHRPAAARGVLMPKTGSAWVLFAKPGRFSVQTVRLGACPPCSLQLKHTSSSSSSSCCLDWRPADPINPRAIAPPASETGVSLRPLTDSKRDCGPQSLPACGALVSRQDRPARVDTTRLHRIESDRSRSDNRGSK